MTEENTNTATEETTATEPAPTADNPTDEFKDADREKLSAVVKKERAASKAQAARADKAEARLAELEANELRRNVAEEKGMTPEQAAFLTGDSAEEMAAAADALLAAFPAPSNSPKRLPRETLRTGATGLTSPGPSVNEVADRVLD